MSDESRTSLPDLLISAISPALIMGLVGSLVFFLAEILYFGKYENRLLHTLFFFVFGIVLVSRISIVLDHTRAAIYGIVLSIVCLIALQAFVDYPKNTPLAGFSILVNAVLITVVWWCSYKLTWDCTFIDERRESSSKGLLAAAGLEDTPEIPGRKRGRIYLDEAEEKPEPQSFWERLRECREQRKKKPHTPGVTVIYFSIAALPIFGLGQSLIPADAPERRSFTFWLAACYVGCAMGLLVTTSFLGLRRYLQQRKLEMPTALTGIWLGMGVVLILVFLAAAAVLPRPYSETPIISMNRAGSSDRQASKNAMLKEDAGKGDGRSGNVTTKGDGKAVSKKGDPGGQSKTGKAEKGGGQSKGKGNSSSKEKGEEGNDKNAKEGEDSGKAKDQKDDPESKGDMSEEKRDDGTNSGDSFERFQNSSLGNVVSKLATILKWLVFIALVIIVLMFLFQHWLQNMAKFMPWLQRLLNAFNNFWARLFGWKTSEVATEPEQEEEIAKVSFRAFSNPFADGSASSRSTEDLIQYSFSALEAWANDHDQSRQESETPIEFAQRLMTTFPSLEPAPQKLSVLVARLAYADSPLPGNTVRVLEEVWDRLQETHTSPMSA